MKHTILYFSQVSKVNYEIEYIYIGETPDEFAGGEMTRVLAMSAAYGYMEVPLKAMTDELHTELQHAVESDANRYAHDLKEAWRYVRMQAGE